MYSRLALSALSLALTHQRTAYAASPGLRRRHGEAGLAFAKTQDWDVINGAVLKTYARAIERRERLARIKG